MANEIVQIHLSLDDVINQCHDVAEQIATQANLLGSKEINLIYLKNGGTLPGETINIILTMLGYKVNTYSPHYGRYGDKREGAVPQLMKNGDLTDEQKIAIVKSVNSGNLTVIVDELIDEGATMIKAWSDIRGYDRTVGSEKYDPKKFKEFVKGSVLNRKTPYFELLETHPLIKYSFIRFHANDPPKGWLTFPWEKESIYYKDHLDLKGLIYDKPTDVQSLRQYLSKKLTEKTNKA